MFTSHKLRIVSVLVGAVLLLSAIVVLRPSQAEGLPKALFWQAKLTGKANYRLVAVGDSRTLRDISPQEFTDFGLGPGLNFGFQGASLNPKILDAAVSRTSDQPKAILLLGITPNAFTPKAQRSNGFDSAVSDLSPTDSLFPKWYFKITQQLEPASLAEIIRIAKGNLDKRKETYHPDGWLETIDKRPSEKHALRFYRDRFTQNMASPELIDRFLLHIQKLGENNVQVFAFRPPITEALANIEDSTSGFRYSDFIKSFESSGGTWIETDNEDYRTYDGSHLQSHAAIQLSRTLAAKIASFLNKH